MTFLERARKLNAATAFTEDGPQNMEKLLRFRRRCWPEILAVVEAARRHMDSLDSNRIELWEGNEPGIDEALDALDKKAGSS